MADQVGDHAADVVGLVGDGGGGGGIDAAEIGGDGGLGFALGVGAEGDGEEAAEFAVGVAVTSDRCR